MTSTNQIIEAHQHCKHNKEAISKSQQCGCFYCGKIFPANKVMRWVDATQDTAICPHCSIDSVIPDSAGYPLTDQFLHNMFMYWFGK